MKSFNKLKRLICYSFALAVLTLTGYKAIAQGAVSAIRFSGAAAGSADMTDTLSQALAQSDFTIEMWIKIRSNASDPVFIGNKNWASGSNTGFVWCRYAANTIRFNFRANTRSRKDYNMTLDYGKWNHIAITVKRNGSITGYVNGRQNGTPISIAADSGYTLHAALPVRMGADGNAAYPINGDMDEVRIWNTVRTEAEIRSNMCHTLSGGESGLMAYYRMDETGGTALNNSAAATSTLFNGSFTSTPDRVLSAAALGDTSVTLYASSYAGQTLSLGSAANGNMQLSAINDDMGGLHLYRINAAPNTTTGVPDPGTNSVYYGVFPVNDTASFTANYTYSNFPDALSYEGGIDLYRRHQADSVWALWGATKDTVANVISMVTQDRSELILGSFVASLTCNAPSGLGAQNITAGEAELNWTTGGSNQWNICYGSGSFTPGTGGTTVYSTGSTGYLLNSLSANTTYSFYVQDTCASLNSTSAWTGPYTFTTAPDYSLYGSGYGINFQGTAANEHVNLGDSLSGAIATTDFTLETWIRFNNNTSDPSFIGNKNWASGQNTGILWCWNGNNNLRFNFKPQGGTRRDYDITVPDPAAWNHIAMVVDRNGYLTAYLNGIQAGTPINISADTGRTLDGSLPVRIGQDGTGVYGPKFKGDMDELRIWKKTLTEAEIRTNMCRKATPGDTALLAYYRMDEASGNTLTNQAATGNVFDGVLTNGPQRIISGAAIGDTSIYIYPAAWAGQSLSLGSAAEGTLTIDSMENNATGLHIYRIDQAPNFTGGIADIGGTGTHFGVYTPGNKMATYQADYDYSSYPNAVANSAGLHLYNRESNADTLWIQAPATNNTASQNIVLSQPMGVRQYILADFSTVSCPAPSSIYTGAVDTSKATLHWTSSAPGHIVEWGTATFSPGSGTRITAFADTLQLDNLAAATVYKFYLQDSCSATGSSAWVGPFYFETLNPCPLPYNVTADSVTTTSMVIRWEDDGMVTQDYIVSWGAQGFGNPAFGIQTNIAEKRFELTGAAPQSEYDFYIRTNCQSSVSNSGWAGPFTFSTLACDVPVALHASAITTTGATIQWSSLAAAHNIEYGPAGFTLGSGQQAATTDTFYHISGLAATTAYEVYVQDSCSETLGSSAWAGPLAFSTAATTGIGNTEQSLIFNLYPNPASQGLTVTLPAYSGKTLVSVRNSLGVTVWQRTVSGKEVFVPTAALPSGLYLVYVAGEGKTGSRKFTVQH